MCPLESPSNLHCGITVAIHEYVTILLSLSLTPICHRKNVMFHDIPYCEGTCNATFFS